MKFSLTINGGERIRSRYELLSQLTLLDEGVCLYRVVQKSDRYSPCETGISALNSLEKSSGGRSLRLKWPESPPWGTGTKFRPRTSGLIPPLICRFTGMTNCGQAGVSVLVRTGVSAPRAETKFRPTSSGDVPPLNCALALEVSIWWGRSLRLESPKGRSLRRARSKLLQTKCSGEHPPDACMNTSSALIMWPETPPWYHPRYRSLRPCKSSNNKI